MLVHTNSSLQCGILGVLRFHKRIHPFSTGIKCSFPCLPTSLAIHDATRNTEFLQIKEGHGYMKMPSHVIEKTESNGVIKKNAEDLILSSSYENAMEALSSLITRQKRGGQSRVGGRYGKLERMSMYLKILGLEDYIAELKVIHVAGTKGKGSTCSFCEAILRECGFRTGLFISPHLIDVRERFHIDGLVLKCDSFYH